jgi:hypothetical protein
MTFSNFNTISPYNPLNTAVATPVFTVFATRDPTTADNAYQPATEWQNQVTGKFWKLVSTGASANWIALSGGSVPSADSFVTNIGGPVVPTGSGAINVNVSTTTFTDGSIANTLKTEVQATNHAILVGRGSQTPINSIGPNATVGLPLISAGASADPQFAILPIAGGGTNANSFTQTNGIVAYNGTSLVNYAGPQLSSVGIMTNTTQPSFFAYLLSSSVNVTGAGTGYFLGTAGGGVVTILKDQASNITIVGGAITFTAPVTGIYMFSGAMNCSGITAAMTTGNCQFNVNSGGNVIATMLMNPSFVRDVNNDMVFSGTIIIPLTTTNTVSFQLSIANGVSDAVTVNASLINSYFAGQLLS